MSLGLPIRVLLLDDEPEILASLVAGLRRARPDWVVETFSSGEDALLAAGEIEHDLVVSDYRMPAMDGVTFLTRHSQRWPDTVRILLTGYPDEHLAIRGINEAHVSAFLVKPASVVKLLELAEPKVDERRAARARDRAFERAGSYLRG